MSRQIVVLARRDPLEAMRVSAGLTIFGHEVILVLMGPELHHDDYQSEQLELLELADIEPLTTVRAMAEHFRLIDSTELGPVLASSDAVLNL